MPYFAADAIDDTPRKLFRRLMPSLRCCRFRRRDIYLPRFDACCTPITMLLLMLFSRVFARFSPLIY